MKHRPNGFLTVALLLVLGVGQIVAFGSSRVAASPALQVFQDDIAAIAERASAAVVSIQSTTQQKMENPFQNFERMLPPGFREQFGPSMPREFEFQKRGLGSGTIIDPNGVILTNNHVVADQQSGKPLENLKVILNDGREFKGTVLGTDAETEVAVIKIEGKNLPSLPLGDSDKLKVGHVVLAIGSPQGLEFAQSVTMGIVSALKRSVGITSYDNLIQTDAAINMGNSGGPLLDIDGRVVGINTAIVSRSGGSEGLGLAIPINQAKQIAEVLRRDGRVQRGYLGIMGKDLEPDDQDMAKILGTGSRSGIIVTQVNPDTPAAKAGLQVQDAVVALNGAPIAGYDEFRNKIAAILPGKTIELTIVRAGKEQKLKVLLEPRPTVAELTQSEDGQPAAPTEESEEKTDLGFTVRALTPQVAQSLGFQGKKGVVVSNVNPTSEAARQGLQARMLIVAMNNRNIESLADFKTAIEDSKTMQSIFLKVEDAKGSAKLIIIPKD